MQSLATLASRRIPIAQIWEEGILNEPLPIQQLQELRERITLENLYNEGLINEDLDPDLFAFALEKSAPGLLWPYISLVLIRPMYVSTNPFSQAGLDYAQQRHGISEEEFITARRSALSTLITELTQFLEEPGLAHDYGNLTIAWSRVEDFWKVISIRITPEPKSEEAAGQEGEFGVPNPLIVNFYTTLDEMISFILEEMENYSDVKTLISFSQGFNELEPDYRAALAGMKTGLQADTEDIWEMLDEGVITLTTNFQLSLADLKDRTRLVVVDNFLYIIVVEEDEDIFAQNILRGSYYLYYPRQDALLILSSLFLTGNAWNLDVDPLFTDRQSGSFSDFLGQVVPDEEVLSEEEIN